MLPRPLPSTPDVATAIRALHARYRQVVFTASKPAQLRMDIDSQRFVGGVQIGNVGSNAAVPRLAKEHGTPLEMETPRVAFQTQSCYFPPAKFRPSSCTSLR